MLRRVVSQKLIDFSEVLSASIITLMMDDDDGDDGSSKHL
jgi:hypothetical protein